MKTKIVKSHCYFQLVVADKAINKKYKCENKPIVLGCITEFAEAEQWRVEDYRITTYLSPSPYLEDGVQQYIPKNQEEKDFLQTTLHTYEIDENTGVFYWPKFNSSVYEGGDHPCLTDIKIKQYSTVARFTFKKAFKLLQEQKAFWESFDNDNLTLPEIRLENSYRQMSDSEVYSHFRYKELETKNKIKIQ